MSHLLAVCALALEHGADEDEAIAALLHDAVEDQGGPPQLEAIRARFGTEDTAPTEAHEELEGFDDPFDPDSMDMGGGGYNDNRDENLEE